ncbi:Lrp/AsnC family transcriptional regulator [Candidatus Heimdallarchaeota archaeon]|nr:MAG: Lrp/AsnC family transcriptional regulator [Candidatus Heimdallarchaeota archaeon]
MVVAYILFVVEPGSENKVADKLIKRKGVKDISVVYGEYDLIAKLEVESMSGLQDFVISVRKNSSVKRTTTMIAVQ